MSEKFGYVATKKSKILKSEIGKRPLKSYTTQLHL